MLVKDISHGERFKVLLLPKGCDKSVGARAVCAWNKALMALVASLLAEYPNPAR